MKIAVPVKESLQIDNHFGHCAFYQIFTIGENGQILSVETMNAPEGCGCKSNMAEVLSQKGVTIMLAGGIGTGAVQKLQSNGIKVIRNCAGGAGEQVNHYLAGSIKDGGKNCSSHENGHTCNHH